MRGSLGALCVLPYKSNAAVAHGSSAPHHPSFQSPGGGSGVGAVCWAGLLVGWVESGARRSGSAGVAIAIDGGGWRSTSRRRPVEIEQAVRREEASLLSRSDEHLLAENRWLDRSASELTSHQRRSVLAPDPSRGSRTHARFDRERRRRPAIRRPISFMCHTTRAME
jgi:hypothetical protein